MLPFHAHALTAHPKNADTSPLCCAVPLKPIASRIPTKRWEGSASPLDTFLWPASEDRQATLELRIKVTMGLWNHLTICLVKVQASAATISQGLPVGRFEEVARGRPCARASLGYSKCWQRCVPMRTPRTFIEHAYAACDFSFFRCSEPLGIYCL